MHQWQGYSIVKESSTLQEENDIKRASIQELSRQLAEAQADNAALSGFIEDLYEDIRFWNRGTYDSEDICNSINNNMEKPTFQQPHPGASLLAELEQLRSDSLELIQLRKIRDAAKGLFFWKSGFAHSETYTSLVDNLGQALAELDKEGQDES